MAISLAIGGNPDRSKGFQPLYYGKTPFQLQYTAIVGVEDAPYALEIIVAEGYTLYTMQLNRVKSSNAQDGILKVAISIPRGERLTYGSPFSLLMDLCAAVVKNYMTPTQDTVGGYIFRSDIRLDDTIFNSLLSNYPTAPYTGSYLPMKGADSAVMELSELDIERLSVDVMHAEFQQFKSVVVASKVTSIAAYAKKINKSELAKWNPKPDPKPIPVPPTPKPVPPEPQPSLINQFLNLLISNDKSASAWAIRGAVIAALFILGILIGWLVFNSCKTDDTEYKQAEQAIVSEEAPSLDPDQVIEEWNDCVLDPALSFQTINDFAEKIKLPEMQERFQNGSAEDTIVFNQIAVYKQISDAVAQRDIDSIKKIYMDKGISALITDYHKEALFMVFKGHHEDGVEMHYTGESLANVIKEFKDTANAYPDFSSLTIFRSYKCTKVEGNTPTSENNSQKDNKNTSKKDAKKKPQENTNGDKGKSKKVETPANPNSNDPELNTFED
jgi:hypothetical protein